jgi:hypothetical protein
MIRAFCSFLGGYGRKDFLPVEPQSRLFPHSAKRSQVRLKPLLFSVQLRWINLSTGTASLQAQEYRLRLKRRLRSSWVPFFLPPFDLLPAAAETALTLTLRSLGDFIEEMRTRFVSAIVWVSEPQLVVGGEAGLTVRGQVGIKRCLPQACLSFLD